MYVYSTSKESHNLGQTMHLWTRPDTFPSERSIWSIPKLKQVRIDLMKPFLESGSHVFNGWSCNTHSI